MENRSATGNDITTIDKHKCTSFIINHCQLFHPNNIQYTSIINICCCVSLGGHAASNKRHSFSVIVVVGHHTIIHLTFASTKQHLIWYSNVYLVVSATARVYCCITYTIHRTERHDPSDTWQASEGDPQIIRCRLIVTFSSAILYKLWISWKESCCI